MHYLIVNRIKVPDLDNKFGAAPLAMITLGIVITGLVGCSSIAKHTKGPVPLGALPPAKIEVTLVQQDHETAPQGKFLGTLKSMTLEHDPFHQFIMVLADSRGQTTRISIVTHFEGLLPDMPKGHLVTVEHNLNQQNLTRIDDEFGSVGWFQTSTHIPELPQNLPFSVQVSQRRGYTRTFDTETTCQWTVVHSYMTVTATDQDAVSMAPGSARLFTVGEHTYLFAALDASSLDESDCDDDTDPEVAWFWLRIDPLTIPQLVKKNAQINTEPPARDPLRTNPSQGRLPRQ